TGVVWSRAPEVVCLRVSGDDAFAVLDRVCAGDLFVRDGQVRPTLVLDRQARVIADAYVGQDDEAYLLITEGPTPAFLTGHLRAEAPEGADLAIEDLTASHDVISVHGPYAWELIGELLGPDLIGLPYLYFYRTEGVFCLRAGKTGEYGYDLLVPREETASFVARLAEKGSAFDLVEVGLAALEQSALENGFFNVRREGRQGLTPDQLGLQWRVSYRKELLCDQALRALREQGPRRRVTTVLSERALHEGDPVWLEGEQIGHLVSAGYSSIAGRHVALALLDQPYFHAGITRFTAGDPASPAPIATVSPPALVNRSLYINPQRHAYSTREKDRFPPIAADDLGPPGADPGGVP
ncbi:MAG: glycine cleavage T C-terminal barrel domain-containing protein, partial [Polyangiaceae bacterium]